MSEKLVVCVATVSEGRNEELINDLKRAIEGEKGISLGVSDGKLSDQTIFTFCGSPETVLQSAISLSKVAHNKIDMQTKGPGVIPRIGAIDDCAFVPARGVSMDECREIAKTFAVKLSTQLEVSVYYYESSETESRKRILRVKAGQHQKLNEIFQKEKPTFGPEKPNLRWGATVVWASEGFLQVNVNLLATKEQAQRIAYIVQELGRGGDQTGPLKGCQALSLWLEDQRIAQVAIILRDIETCTLREVYEQVQKEANALVLPVLGSEIVGMVPLKALLETADFHINKDRLYVLEEDHKIALAVAKLGLNATEAFIPEKRIIEYNLPPDPSCPLIQKSLRDFIRTVGARIPVPAGGSAAATVGSLGAALASMVAKMTYGKKQWEKFDSQMRSLIPVVHSAMEEMMHFIDADTAAFNQLLDGMRLPSSTPEEKERRTAALDEATIKTIEVPMELARSVSKTWKTAEELAHIITAGAISDLRVSAWCLELAVKAAHSSIMENIRDLPNQSYKEKVAAEIEEHLKKAKVGRKSVHNVLAERLH